MKSDLNALLYGEFKPDVRQVELYERLKQYYQDTPNEMDNRTAMKHWKEFKKWCNYRGYTQEEINSAKSGVIGGIRDEF